LTLSVSQLEVTAFVRMRSAVTVSLVPEAKSGPFVFSNGLEDAFSSASELGFEAVEIFPRSGPELDATLVSALVKRHGLRVAAVGTGAGWVAHKLTLTHGNPAVRKQAREFVRAIIDASARWDSPAIIGSMQGRWDDAVPRDVALGFLGEALDDLGTHAARHGVPLLFEPLNRYETNMFNRIDDTAAWLNHRTSRNVRILADLFHMGIEESNSAAALRASGALVGHVHFADSNRRAVAMGQTAIGPVIEALKEIGYDGYLSAEIFPLPDPLTAARQTISSFKKFTASS
jgi:sugar phosphate isomerase/epimerase